MPTIDERGRDYINKFLYDEVFSDAAPANSTSGRLLAWLGDNGYTVAMFFDEYFSVVDICNPDNLLSWLSNEVHELWGQLSDLSRDDASFPLGRFLDDRKLIEIALMTRMLEDTVEDIEYHVLYRARERAT